MPQVQFHLDLNQNELRQAVIHRLSTAPSTPLEGQLYYDTVTKALRNFDGTIWQSLVGADNSISSITISAPLVNTGTSQAPIIGIPAASSITAGSLSISDKDKLDGATALSTASTLTLRDSSGAITATSFIGPLTGLASNASQLESQVGTYYLSRTNHSGSQLASTISNFDTQVRTNRLDQLAAPTVNLNLNSNKITNLATPTLDTDAVTKLYVDSRPTGVGKYNTSIGDGSSTSITITHNLNTRDVVAHIYTTASPYSYIITDIDHTTVNTITLTFSVAPTTNQYRVVVIG
jgi:hypothetical protein